MKRDNLLLGHLEDVSWKVLENYRRIIGSMIRGRHGVYALYKSGRLYYVGLASNLNNRINSHLRDRHRGKWDRFSVYLTVRSEHIRELEALLLRIVNPAGNRTSAKLTGSENLLLAMHRRLREDDADRRAAILGGSIAKRRSRNKARRGRGNIALAGFVERSTALRAIYRGKTYRATLRPDGTIRLAGKLYPSPSAAARVVVRRQTNGWAFWRYRDHDREWQPLEAIRK